MELFNESIRNLISQNVDIDVNFDYEKFKVGRSNITFKIERKAFCMFSKRAMYLCTYQNA